MLHPNLVCRSADSEPFDESSSRTEKKVQYVVLLFSQRWLLQSVPINTFRMTDPSYHPSCSLWKSLSDEGQRCAHSTDTSAQTSPHRDFNLQTKTPKRNKIKQENRRYWSLLGLMINARCCDSATPQLMNEACAQLWFLRHFYKRSQGRLRFGNCISRISFIN